MKIKKRTVTAWTPELGGDFDDLKLEITAFLFGARRSFYQKFVNVNRKGGEMEIGIDAATILQEQEKNTMKSIVGWKNFVYHDSGEKIPCTPENVEFYLSNMMHLRTGIAKPSKDPTVEMQDDDEVQIEYYTLHEYIDWFSGEVENYEKN